METNFNFNSQVATSREQSEHLLVLGLKKETADCHYGYSDGKWKMGEGCNSIACENLYPNYYIPAWSLHRLLCIVNLYTAILRRKIRTCHKSFEEKDNLYDNLIDCISWLIKEGYLNKEYLQKNLTR